MRMRLIRKSIKNIWQIIVIVWLVFAYQLMLNMVPDEVKLIDGDLSKLDISMPVTFECRDSGKRFIDTSVMENQRLQSSMDKAGAERNEIDREITHTVNALNDMGDIVRLYSKNPETAQMRLTNLLLEKDSDLV